MFAHATNAASAFEFFSCCAYGVRSAAPNGDRIFETVWPLLPKIDLTAATLPAPNAVSSAKTAIFLPRRLRREDVRARRGRPAASAGRRGTCCRLRPVIASDAARARDVEHVVLRRERRRAGARCPMSRARDDLHALADLALERGDRGRRIGRVVDVGRVDRVAAALALRVGEAGVEAVEHPPAEGRETAGLRVDEGDVDGLRGRAPASTRAAAVPASAAATTATRPERAARRAVQRAVM